MPSEARGVRALELELQAVVPAGDQTPVLSKDSKAS